MIAYLFDIDGTLVRAGGAGSRALTAVMWARYGVADATAGIAFAGRTDGWIVATMFDRALGRAPEPGEADAVLADYVAELERGLPGSLRVLPDVADVLRWLAGRPEVRLGVATGNIAAGARAKLAVAGLDGYFGFGGYGCDALERPALVAAAKARAGVGPGDVAVVVGDTVHDVAAARACGARVVAVTTGGDDRATLEAAGADVVFDRLGELPAWHDREFAAGA